ncbi:hypothetical protein [Nocardia sp. NPDC057030]|uniref:hypothetical protein n=1 Tax=Nocardia sp. NPDC057030 TaxID=3346005 RepID=UPI003628C91B
MLAVAGAGPAADAHPDATANGPGTESAIPTASLTALLAQADARAASAEARGASALVAIASVNTNEPGTEATDTTLTLEVKPAAAEYLPVRPSLPAVSQAATAAARAAAAALKTIERLPNPPKNLHLTAAAAKRAADQAALAPADITLANLAATAENKALAASAAEFGTTATKVEWVAGG